MMKKILVVEDSRTQAERLEAVIRGAGYEVRWAGDGEDALNTIAAWPPDLVVTDVVMPRMDGYTLCQRLRANPTTLHLPVVMLTSKGEPLDIIRGLEVGADNFITKPYDDELLIRRIHRIFNDGDSGPERKLRVTMELELFGQRIAVTPEKQQIVELLLSSMEDLTATNEELRQRTMELEKATLQASDANRAKSEFLSHMSHELRTPLNAILGFAQLLQLDSLNPEQRESVAHILKGGRHLLDLINEVLDIARIEAGRLHISLEPVSVAEVVRESLDLIAPPAVEGSIRIEAGESTAFVLADRQRLKQVLLNLLSNAVKYNHKRGRVALSFEKLPAGRLRVKVTDTGPGITAERLEHLFTPFERLGAEQSGVEGSGLGLALSKRLVEAMGGTLGVESTPGQGSTFWAELAMTEAPIQRLDQTGVALPAAAELNASDEVRIVLYIEDNLSNLKLIQRLIAHRPEVRLIPAMQGRLGLDLAREHRPHLIFLDLNLPDVSGEEVLQRLQADPETRPIAVVIVSADATPSQIKRLRAEGARDYLTKPVDVKKFLDVLDKILKAHVGDRVTTSDRP